MHHKQLGLGTVLPRAQACDGVGSAVELPGLGHSCCGRGKCKEGQRRCTGAPGRAERVDMPARPGAAQSCCTEAAGDAARCSVPVTAAVRRSPTSPRSCCAAGRTRRQPGARHGLSARPAGGARSEALSTLRPLSPTSCYMCYVCYTARCYMCYMCYILHAKPRNLHSPPAPCYMYYYMCYILCTREICTIYAI